MGRGQGVQQTKGVGGYRPTINWREIAVRKKLVADKQVLACIVASGVVIVAAGVILTVLGFLVIGSQCPFQWRAGAGACYYFAPHNATWVDGRSFCTSQSASLLHLHSRSEDDFITEEMAGRSWLGARRKPGQQGVWVWVDTGAALNYTRWPGGTTPASLQKDLCAAVEADGQWTAVECDAEEMAYVICDYKPGYNPFVLVGPVVTACGVVVLVLSVEVCVRRREFISKNPKPDDQDDDERQVDEGIINYGYGNYGADDEEKKEDKEEHEEGAAEGKNPDLERIQKVVVSPERKREEEGEEEEVETKGGELGSPTVEVIPASPSSLTPPSVEENSPSQENLELLLSPKTLE